MARLQRVLPPLDEEEVASQIDAMIGHETWDRALIRFARFGPITGNLETNREVIKASNT